METTFSYRYAYAEHPEGGAAYFCEMLDDERNLNPSTIKWLKYGTEEYEHMFVDVANGCAYTATDRHGNPMDAAKAARMFRLEA